MAPAPSLCPLTIDLYRPIMLWRAGHETSQSSRRVTIMEAVTLTLEAAQALYLDDFLGDEIQKPMGSVVRYLRLEHSAQSVNYDFSHIHPALNGIIYRLLQQKGLAQAPLLKEEV